MTKDKTNENFEIILININETINKKKIICVKKYLNAANYCAISYRWGEIQEQLVDTSNYIAHITSFKTSDLIQLCYYIKKSLNLSYLWIDAISINQLNQEERKKTIYRMTDIYSIAENVIAVPDLYKEYLLKNNANIMFYKFLNNNINMFKKIFENKYFIIVIYEYHYKKSINEDTFILEKLFEELFEKKTELDIDMIYNVTKWFQYIIDEWRSRSWVISERLIGIKKSMIIYSLLLNDIIDINNFYYGEINDNIFAMILNSKTSKHEDRFYAILPHTKYKKYIEYVTNWKLFNMTDVTLKLLEIVDLNDKITYLLNKKNYNFEILPFFATNYYGEQIENYVNKWIKIYVNDIFLQNKYLFIKTNYYEFIEKDINTINENILCQLGLLKNDDIVNLKLYQVMNIHEENIIYYSLIIQGNISQNKWVILKNIFEYKDKIVNIEKKEMKTFKIY